MHGAGTVTVALGAVFWKLQLGLSLSLSSTMSGLNGKSPDFAKLLRACSGRAVAVQAFLRMPANVFMVTESPVS